MDNVIDIIKSTFLFKEDVNTDNLVFKICGRISVGICISFALLVAATQGKLSLHQETNQKRACFFLFALDSKVKINSSWVL